MIRHKPFRQMIHTTSINAETQSIALLNFKVSESLTPEKLQRLQDKLLVFLDKNGFSSQNGFELKELVCKQGSTEIIIVFVLKGLAAGVLSAIGALFFSFVRQKYLDIVSKGEVSKSAESEIAIAQEFKKISKVEEDFGKAYKIKDYPLPSYDFKEALTELFAKQAGNLPSKDFTAKFELVQKLPEGNQVETLELQFIDGELKKYIGSKTVAL